MTREDARNFLIAMNNVAAYVPPMLMVQVTNSPVARLIEQVANQPEVQQGEQQQNIERPKPHVVT